MKGGDRQNNSSICIWFRTVSIVHAPTCMLPGWVFCRLPVLKDLFEQLFSRIGFHSTLS